MSYEKTFNNNLGLLLEQLATMQRNIERNNHGMKSCIIKKSIQSFAYLLCKYKSHNGEIYCGILSAHLAVGELDKKQLQLRCV